MKAEMKKALYNLLKAILACIAAGLGIAAVQSCTTVFTTTNKGRQQVTIENQTEVSADSASIKFKNLK